MNNLFGSVFQDKTILVTGHTGFIGSWLSLWLTMLGSNVIGYSLKPPTSPSLFEILDLEKNLQHNIGDIRSISDLEKTINDNKPSFIFHLAAQPLVYTSYEIPLETIETNVLGTANLLDITRNLEYLSGIVVMTSDKCYDNSFEKHAHVENDPMGGFDPYSASKGAAELITNAYRNSFFNSKKNNTGLATVRAGNVIGGGDWSQYRLVPDCIKSINSNIAIRLRNPNATRPWQHVLEPISGILWLANRISKDPKKFNGSWNLGPSLQEKQVTVEELVQSLIEKHDSKIPVESDNDSKLHESNLLSIDPSKSENELHLKNILSIDESITETVSWYKAFHNHDEMKNFSINQIERFIMKAKERNLLWAQ